MNLRKISLLCLLLCYAFFASGCAYWSSKADDSKPVRFRNEFQGFSIVPPDGWKPNYFSNAGGNSGAETCSANVFMAFLTEPKQGFSTNLNVNISKDDDLPIEQFGQFIKPAYKKQFEDWSLVEEGLVDNAAGQKMYFISSKFKMFGYHIRNLQYFIRGSQKRMYVLTFTALVSNYSDYEELFKKSATSVETLN